jgi:hypothetical protein
MAIRVSRVKSKTVVFFISMFSVRLTGPHGAADVI